MYLLIRYAGGIIVEGVVLAKGSGSPARCRSGISRDH